MRVIPSVHREDEGKEIIALRFKALEQFFDQSDPSGPATKELTPEAEESIISNADVVHLKKPVRLDLLFPPSSGMPSSTEIVAAVRHHFSYLLDEHKRETRIFIRHRRTSVFFTVFNALLAVIFLLIYAQHPDLTSTILGVLLGGLIIILNWTTVWDTYEFFIYDGRFNYRRRKLLRKIIASEIRVCTQRMMETEA
jgi:hypothetical protein